MITLAKRLSFTPMKSVIASLLFGTAVVCTAQTFTVIKVAGNVTLATGQKVTVRQTLKATAQLVFETDRDYLIVISPETSRKTIRKVPAKKAYELEELLRSFITPDQRATASRSAEMTYLHKLQTKLTHERLLILGDGQIAIDTTQLPLKPPAGIIAYNTQPGVQRVYRNIYAKGSIFLDKKNLLGDAAFANMPRVYVEYVPDTREDMLFAPTETIGNFVPVYPDETQLLQELKAIMDGVSENSIMPEITAFLRAEYGMPIKENLLSWLQAKELIR